MTVLRTAVVFAQRTSRNHSEEIHQRHLWAALISPQKTESQVQQRLVELGIDLDELRRGFRKYIRLEASGDLQAEWDKILTPGNTPAPELESYTVGPVGYTPEFCGIGDSDSVRDHLGVEGLAHRLAELIALRETRLPLAVGLFGKWGSGKSHFMNLMDQHMKDLVPHKPEGEIQQEDSGLNANYQNPWCREIVSIYFNAWHYHDTNLWASLITEIFDALFAHLQPRSSQAELLRTRLLEAEGASARAEENMTQAHDAVLKATAALELARKGSETARGALAGMMDSLRNLIPQLNTPANQQHLTEILGVEGDSATLSLLKERYREMASLLGRIRLFWRRATTRDGLAIRIGWLVGTLIIVPILLSCFDHFLPMLKAWLTPFVQGSITFLAGAGSWVVPAINNVSRQLREMEKWQSEAEKAQKSLPKNEGVVAAQKQVFNAEAAAISAEAELTRMRALESKLKQEMDDLRPERRLSRFIEARVRSSDYRGHLGLISLARRDFQALRKR